MKIEVYGASDDLIEIEGDIRDEFYALGDDEPNYLAFSDGAILKIVYDDDGMWRISPLAVGSAVYEMVQGSDPGDDYSDHAWLTGNVTWVVHGKSVARV